MREFLYRPTRGTAPMKIICINGQWYVYVAGPFSTREAAEKRLVAEAKKA